MSNIGGGGGGGSGYATIDNAGTPVTARTVANLLYGLLAADNGGTSQTDLSAALTTASAQLSADVTMVSASTFYDGPSVSLVAGTWIAIAAICCTQTAGADSFIAKLWDGTTVVASDESTTRAANVGATVTLAGIVTPGSTTTYKISAAVTSGGSVGRVKAATPEVGQGNNASWILAVRIG